MNVTSGSTNLNVGFIGIVLYTRKILMRLHSRLSPLITTTESTPHPRGAVLTRQGCVERSEGHVLHVDGGAGRRRVAHQRRSG